MSKNEFRPKFHFSCPIGWMNDPNGFSFFNGEFHLYYQHYPKDTKWGPMHWGHATSADLLHWTNHPIALYPDSDADNQGCFSGTALTENDRQVLIYTGVTSDGQQNIQQQCIAIHDGTKFTKLPQNPVIKTGNVKTPFRHTDFRDPKIWKEDDTYFCACVIQKEDLNGAIVLFTSRDLINWEYKNIIAQTNGEMGGMWECPDFFQLDGKDVIIVSPQSIKADNALGFHNGNNSVYMTGTLDKTDYIFHPHKRPENNFTAAEIDYGIDFYAPQTTLSPDGRRLMIAWLQAWESPLVPENYNWTGMMIMPRELVIKNNRLYQHPIREYEDFVSKMPIISGTVGSGNCINFDEKSYFQFELNVKFTCHYDSQCKENLSFNDTIDYKENSDCNTNNSALCQENFALTIYDNDGQEVRFILCKENLSLNNTLDCKENNLCNSSNDALCKENCALSDQWLLTFDRSKSINGGGAINERSVKIHPDENGQLNLRFIVDTFSCEVFVNDGETLFTNAFYLNENVRNFKIESTLSCGLDYKFIDLSE